MSVQAMTDAGVVRFVCSYRRTWTGTVGGRRFEVGWDDADRDTYYCVSEADAAAFQAYKQAESDDLAAWCAARGWAPAAWWFVWRVVVDPARWERIIYPNAGPDGWQYQLDAPDGWSSTLFGRPVAPAPIIAEVAR